MNEPLAVEDQYEAPKENKVVKTDEDIKGES
jgi:hypothetical protein